MLFKFIPKIFYSIEFMCRATAQACNKGLLESSRHGGQYRFISLVIWIPAIPAGMTHSSV